MEMRMQRFRGREFRVIRGTTHPEYSYFTFEEEERDLRERYWNVKEGDIVVDVGSSYGAYALTACAMGATVHAFEPEPTVFEDLLRNIVLNGWGKRCLASCHGLWSASGKIDMRSYAPHWPRQTISGDYEMETLDGVLEARRVQRCDWIKVDVEGAEEHVVKGALKTIAQFGPRMLIECHTFLDAGLAEKVKSAILSVREYEFEAIDRPPCVMLYAKPLGAP